MACRMVRINTPYMGILVSKDQETQPNTIKWRQTVRHLPYPKGSNRGAIDHAPLQEVGHSVVRHVDGGV